MLLFRDTVTILRNDRADKKLTHRVKADLFLQSARTGVEPSAVEAIAFLSSEDAKRLLSSIAGVRSVLVEPPPLGATNKHIREGARNHLPFRRPSGVGRSGQAPACVDRLRGQHRQGPGEARERGVHGQGASRRHRGGAQEPGSAGARRRAPAHCTRSGFHRSGFRGGLTLGYPAPIRHSRGALPGVAARSRQCSGLAAQRHLSLAGRFDPTARAHTARPVCARGRRAAAVRRRGARTVGRSGSPGAGVVESGRQRSLREPGDCGALEPSGCRNCRSARRRRSPVSRASWCRATAGSNGPTICSSGAGSSAEYSSTQ